MQLNFGRSSRSDGSATPPAEPVGEVVPEPDGEAEELLPTGETAPSPDAERTEPVDPVDLVEAIDAEPATAASIEPWPDEDRDAVPVVHESVRRGRNDDPAPVGLTAPTPPSGWTDPMTSADGPRYWDRLISSERDRIRRYQRPATIVFIELGNLDQLGALWGEDVAAQSLIKVGRTLMGEIRSSDHAARIDLARFGVFLPETDEIAAINFVERVRAAIDRSLGFMDQTLQVGIGWASPADADIDVALTVAEQRLAADLGRA